MLNVTKNKRLIDAHVHPLNGPVVQHVDIQCHYLKEWRGRGGLGEKNAFSFNASHSFVPFSTLADTLFALYHDK